MSRLRNAAIGITAAGAMAIGLVGQWEGLKLYAYKDVIGVWTACYGETKGIKPGMKFTKAECDTMFIESLEKHERGMRACLANPDSVPIKPYVAFVSLTYNIGVGSTKTGKGFCGSSMPRLINAGKIKEACERLMSFNRAGGKAVKGLTNRRADERKLCLSGI